MKKINENASSGSITSGNIASAPTVLNYQIHRRIPKFEYNPESNGKYTDYINNNYQNKKDNK